MRKVLGLSMVMAAACGDSETSRSEGNPCSADGWCLVSPSDKAMAGAGYTAVWGTSSGEIWAVGNYVAHVYANGQWACAPIANACATASIPEAIYHAVETGKTDGVVVLAQWDRVMTYEGQMPMQLGVALSGVVQDLSVLSTTDILAAVDNTVMRWDTNGWSVYYTDTTLPARRMHAVWQTTSTWAVGERGLVAYLDGGWRTPDPAVTGEDLFAIWGHPTHTWVVGAAGTTIRFDFTDPISCPIPCPTAHDAGVASTLRALWGFAPDQVWAAGDAGVIIRWDGLRWIREQSGTTRDLTGLWGDATALWAVGGGGTVLRKAR